MCDNITCRKNNRFMAPYKIVEYEKSYLLWVLFVIFFGLINIWVSVALWDGEAAKTAFSEGICYTFGISVCAPLVAESLIKIIVDKRNKNELHFITYKIVSALVSIFFITILAFFWVGSLKGSVFAQILFAIISLALSFYIFCVNQMEEHKELLELFDDDEYEYIDNENNSINELRQKSEGLKTIQMDEGEIQL